MRNVCATRAPVPSLYSSYGFLLPPFRSAAELLCAQPASRIIAMGSQHSVPDANHLHTVIIFKVARSGSHVFADIIMGVLERANLRTLLHWEPWSGHSCMNKKRETVEAAFPFLLSRCSYNYSVPGKTNKCIHPIPNFPGGYGTCPNHVDVSITALNSRKSFSVRWSVLAPQYLPPASAVIVLLRRTNLAALAYSKFEHGGCQVHASTNDLHNKTHGSGKFDLHMLLECAWSYGVGDQEFASSNALTAATASNASVHLLIYEDLLANPEQMQEKIAVEVLGHPLSGWILPKREKLHNTSLCNNNHVDCATTTPSGDQPSRRLLVGLNSVRYPCLVRHWLAEPEVAFTVPRSANGIIDLSGDCSSMKPTSGMSRLRSLEELYF